MGRYDNIYNVKTAFKPVKTIPPIDERETDIHFEFNSADRLDLVSQRIYGSPEYWWVILAANKYQFEYDIPYGEILRVPYPLITVLNEIRSKIK